MSEPVASILTLDDGIAAVDTEYMRPNMDASHLIVEGGRAAFVDTGVNSAVPMLLDALRHFDLDVGDVDYVFVTHVHLDHAGGAGLLMQHLPNARCVLHPRAERHMIDPTKLIAGTEAVYGKEQAHAMYGTIRPIDADRVVVAEDQQRFDLNGRELEALHTEGHARHHYVLNDPKSRGVFTGDSFGISYRDLDTAAGVFIYPTTTPIDFDPVQAHVSIDRIMACEPEHVYLTHYSRVADLDRLAADMHGDIDALVALAERAEHDDDRLSSIEAGMFEHWWARLQDHGYEGSRDEAYAIVEMDVKLNSMGLDVWLTRRAKAASN